MGGCGRRSKQGLRAGAEERLTLAGWDVSVVAALARTKTSASRVAFEPLALPELHGGVGYPVAEGLGRLREQAGSRTTWSCWRVCDRMKEMAVNGRERGRSTKP